MYKPSSINSVDRVRKTKSHDSTITFTLQLTLDENKNYYLAVDSVNMSYRWHNVSAN